MVPHQRKELNDVFKEQWYHSIELFPGQFVLGQDHANIAITRALLRGCEIENMNCIDIGAQDFLVTLLLLRRKAKRVLAYDRLKKEARADFLKNHFHVDFDYINGLSLSELPTKLLECNVSPFDVAIFSGVLYHTFDPLAALALVRGLVRNGGVLVIETAAILNNTMAMYFNAAGRFYSYGTYWMISVECLDYLLRLLRLAPLDCLYLGYAKEIVSAYPTPKNVGRVGVVCRAVEASVPSKDDKWMSKSSFSRNFDEFLDWKYVESDLPEVMYTRSNTSLVFRKDTKIVDIFKTIQQSSSIIISNPDEQLRLKLDAQW